MKRARELERTTNHSTLRALRALSLAALICGSTSSASAQTVTLSRNQARPTSELTVTARGFSQGESVELWLGEEPVRTTVVDGSGTGGPWSVRVPAESLPGELLVSVVGEGDAAAEAALLVTTPWGQYGYDQQRTRFNPHENVLTAAAVSTRGLRRKWRVTSKGPFDSAITYRSAVKNGALGVLDLGTGDVRWGGAAQGGHSPGWTSSAAVYGRVFTTGDENLSTRTWAYMA